MVSVPLALVEIRGVVSRNNFPIKDHLGNLRLAYRQGGKATYIATMETDPASRAAEEEKQWDQPRLTATRAAVGNLARTGTYVARLNAAAGTPIGPLKLLAVQKGDTVMVTAPGYYPQPVASTSSYTFSLLGFVAQLLQQAPPPPVLVGEAARPVSPLPFLSLGLAVLPALPQVNSVPKGYVRLLTFNKDQVLLASQTRQLSTLAGTGYEELRLAVVAPENGYVEAYVGNESEVDVYFDDVTLELRQGLQVQENSYDPWGLSLAGLERNSPSIKGLNQYQFNGKERQNDLGLGWSDMALGYTTGNWDVGMPWMLPVRLPLLIPPTFIATIIRLIKLTLLATTLSGQLLIARGRKRAKGEIQKRP